MARELQESTCAHSLSTVITIRHHHTGVLRVDSGLRHMSSIHKAPGSIPGTEKNRHQIILLPTVAVVTASVPRVAVLPHRLVLDFPTR